ncbi:MAG: hypothetical protein P9L92_20660 [Candidatus Electryonea clarkiae]|nr:hypothetical protein [Candidatus Electryonea clarkiae]MDP8288881.1 hypothetical protein [Candidatus Electryonea clarkiae]
MAFNTCNRNRTTQHKDIERFRDLLLDRMILKFFLSFILLSPFLSVNVANAYGNFLLMAPGARATGMGEAQVALVDPMSGYFNAGSNGIFSLDHVFSISHSNMDWIFEADPYEPDRELSLDYSQVFAGWKIYRVG